MSEYQFVVFRAIDRPVSEKNLEYMRRQSSRADITPWSFENEYNYSDFRGNADEMLRRGYDIYIHFANFGIRKIKMRIPFAMLHSPIYQPYFVDDRLAFAKDKTGESGILTFSPYFDAGELDEPNLDPLLEDLVPLRAEILAGDLRPLYIAHLAVSGDMESDPDEATEGPTPAGLDKPTRAQLALAEFFGLSRALLDAAADAAPPMPANLQPAVSYEQWLKSQPVDLKDRWLAAWMTDATASDRMEMLAAYNSKIDRPPWPVATPNRKIADLQAAEEHFAQQAKIKEAAAEARKRAKRLAAMASNPEATIRETEKLVENRTTESYAKIAALLVDLRDALAGTAKAAMAETHAAKLNKTNPTLKNLTGAMRRAGLLPKRY